MKHRSSARSQVVYTIALIGFIYALHIVIPMYSNSSFLNVFADEKTVGLIYMIGSAVSILGFLIGPFFIRVLGNYVMALILTLVQIVIFYVLVTADSPIWISAAFALQMATSSLIGLTLDIFLEVYTDSHNVGKIRGLFTTALNASWLAGPLIGSVLINGTTNYRSTYLVALAILFPFLYLVYKNFPKFRDPKYTHFSPWQLIRHISSNKDWTKLFLANTILQVFYAWMVVYSPIYLNKHLGFNWTEIGIILTIMLLPFILFQYPLGKLADKKYGEKEIMAIGFGIMGIGTIILSFVSVPNVWIWAGMLFITRVGAAAAEIMLETYFFKTVSPNDSAVLGGFRITRPIAFFIAPLITAFGLMFTSHTYIFIIVGLITLIALWPVLSIKDTK